MGYDVDTMGDLGGFGDPELDMGGMVDDALDAFRTLEDLNPISAAAHKAAVATAGAALGLQKKVDDTALNALKKLPGAANIVNPFAPKKKPAPAAVKPPKPAVPFYKNPFVIGAGVVGVLVVGAAVAFSK